nr:hypothetical protein [Streptomyces sp. S3(2020)]
MNPFDGTPKGLTSRACGFLSHHCVRVDIKPMEQHRQKWLELDIPAEETDRVVAFQRRWGGLALPPSPRYEGGFMIGPGGEFGLHSWRWTALHETIEGCVESLALAHHAALWAKCITKVTGDEVEAVALDGYQPVREVRGLADTWWRGADSLVAIYNGEADCLSAPRSRTALIYSGLDEWGLGGDVGDDEG